MIERIGSDDAKAEERPAATNPQLSKSGTSDPEANGLALVAHDALAELFAEVAHRLGQHVQLSYVGEVGATVTVKKDELSAESCLSLTLTADNIGLSEDIPYRYITSVMERWNAALVRLANDD